MPTFDTPNPIAITVDIVGHTRITASDRSDTVVTVEPLTPSRSADVKGAAQTLVEHTDGRLLIKSPKGWALIGPSASVVVTLEVPTGSSLDGTSAFGDFHAEGELGATKVKTAMGAIRLDACGELRAKTSFGDVTVDRVDGNADVSTSSGELRLGDVAGGAVLKNSNGNTEVSRVTGDVRVKSANGDVLIGHAGGGVTARTANGNVRVGEVRRGQVVIETGLGELEVGVAEGTAAWLDLNTRFGSVQNRLDGADGPESAESTVEVRARSSLGDIVIRRVTGSRR